MINQIKKQYYNSLFNDNSTETKLYVLKTIKRKLMLSLMNPDISKQEKQEAYDFLYEISHLPN